MYISVPVWICASNQGSCEWSIMLSAVHRPSIHYPSMEETSAMINYLVEAIVSFRTGYVVCCSKHLHNSLALFGALSVPDSDSTCHLCQGIWLRLSSPSWETHHGSSSQRNPRCRSILPSSSSSIIHDAVLYFYFCVCVYDETAISDVYSSIYYHLFQLILHLTTSSTVTCYNLTSHVLSYSVRQLPVILM